jgi:hypothetical protein
MAAAPKPGSSAYSSGRTSPAVRIVAGGGQVKSYLSTVLVTTVTEHEFKEAGHIGV